MKTDTIKQFIKTIELFEGFSTEELEEIAQKMEVKQIAKGELLFNELKERNHLYIIYNGEIELFKKTPFGEEKKLSFFTKYDFLGEGAFIQDAPHSTSARAVRDTVVLTWHSKAFKALHKNQPDIALRLITKIASVISRRMSHANTRLVNVSAQYVSGRTRREHDLLGERDVPAEFYYGVQTLRAIENFNISGVNLHFFPLLIEGFAMVKKAAALANHRLGLLSDPVANAIVCACDEILNGKHHKHFIVDMIQGGAGTSTNMNANEVIANRALELLGKNRGEYKYCHPNNHVNLSQSTNDVYPTAVKIALINSNKTLIKVLLSLIESFRTKGKEFADVIKMGRTQLQDAVPMTLGQSFDAYSATLTEEVERLTQNANLFLEVNMGATAIGTGINAEPGYKTKVIEALREVTGLNIVPAIDLVEATQDAGPFIMYSSAVKRLAIKLSKISNDLRLLSSGPRCGLNEINLPPMQPGSSIMPGKVNPVIPEVVNQIAFKVIGNDLTVNLAVEAGQLELNVMEPVIVQSMFESIEMLKNGMETFRYRCIDGISANKTHCRNMVMNSIGLVTALNPVLGYEVCTEIAKEALDTNRSVYDLILEKQLLSKEKLDEILKPENMITPQKTVKKTTK